MALFKKLFSKSGPKTPKGFHTLKVLSITKATSDTVKVELDVPSELSSAFEFTSGQYLNFSVTLNGKEQRRSYSICSGKNEPLAVAVKQVEKGLVSTWFNNEVKADDEILVAKPEGNFTKANTANNIVAIAAGSGITPILSMAKAIESSGGTMNLFYGNKTESSIIFKSDIDALSNTTAHYYLSSEQKDGFQVGRIDKETFSTAIKANLELLKADGFFLCGPEQMIMDIAETLETFGVAKDKVHYELFTDPVLMKSETSSAGGDFEGTSKITVVLDGERTEFDLHSSKPILAAAIEEGVDAPYSCKGGVCSTCKAKVIKGKVDMKLNYSLTDADIEDGFVLSCQAHPCSPEVVLSYDE